MSCGCANTKDMDNKNINKTFGQPREQSQSADQPKLSLDQIKNMSIDETINLYRQGYTLQGADNQTISSISGNIPSKFGFENISNQILNQDMNQENISNQVVNQDNIKSLSPCVIQAALFQKNGSISFNCTATISDRIDVDNVVTFDASFSGVPVWCKVIVQVPDGTSREINGPTFNIITGTQDIIINIPISIYGTGTYKIIATHIALESNGAYICDMYYSGASCQTITVTGITPPPFTTIIISPTTASIQVGGTQQLTAVCKNSIGGTITCPTLLWTSTNTSVATVSQTGLVTGLIGGTTGITANYTGIQSNFSDITVTAVTNPTVFNVCWKVGLPTTGQCAIPPDQPPITSGTSFIIKADITNTGPSGKVRAEIKDGTTVLSDQNIANLGTYPSGGFWSPYVSFTMPNRNVTLIVNAYGWNGTSWVLTHTVTSTISMSTPTCTGISLTPFTQTVNTGGTVNFTATTTPSTTQFTVNFKLRNGTVISSKTTTGGVATYTWTAPSTAGTYYVHAEVGSPVQCTSTESVIQVNPPIVQHNVNITVKDSVTYNNIQGASVTIGTQTLSTDANGFVTFLVNEGSISVSITKTGYNTYTTTELVYSDITKTYLLVPVTPTTGSLRFITVPTAADVYFGTTLKGTTDASTGILSIGSLNAGPISYTVKKTGYNDATGTATVAGGTTTDVPVTLTPVTPTTGDVCLKSNPAGASIKIDGTIQSGKTTALSTGGCTAPNTITGLSPGSHSYTLSLTGYQDKTGTFIITVGQVNNVDAGPLTLVTTIGSLTISSVPSGARIYIDNIDSGYVTSATVSNIAQGSHTYKLILTGYKDATGTFNITAGETTTVSAITLVQRVGTLKFFSAPVGATISIGGVSKGTTTETGLVVSNLPIGSTDYTATLAGYDIYNGTETVIEDITTSITITLTPTITGKGSLVIDTIPHGAEIFIDGTDKQLVTPHTFTGMDVGGHAYQLQKSGYYTISEIFAITAGETTTITKTLQSTGTVEAGGTAMLFIGLAALGIIMTHKPPKSPISKLSNE